jgi:hypothetical protein
MMYIHKHQLAVDLPCACTTMRKAARAISRVYDTARASLDEHRVLSLRRGWVCGGAARAEFDVVGSKRDSQAG